MVLHLADVGKSFPADTNPDSSLSAQHPLVPLPNPCNPGNEWSAVARDLILEGLHTRMYAVQLHTVERSIFI